ncbi:hypothetical protein CIPAW_14G106400 [Carya illinoinensis]|uniref:Uncharacterized protein n=1 Tax=Carya illinoinensis TaxID=32201 RepID=A0A8T1NLG2_CARIL|nr:hypothetical protein CIPAW_14G106400 [Carya illinoinensis]
MFIYFLILYLFAEKIKPNQIKSCIYNLEFQIDQTPRNWDPKNYLAHSNDSTGTLLLPESQKRDSNSYFPLLSPPFPETKQRGDENRLT